MDCGGRRTGGDSRRIRCVPPQAGDGKAGKTQRSFHRKRRMDAGEIHSLDDDRPGCIFSGVSATANKSFVARFTLLSVA